MKPHEIHIRRVGLRWGMALEALKHARVALETVKGIGDFLDEEQRKCVNELSQVIGDTEIALWSAESQVLNPKTKKRGKKR